MDIGKHINNRSSIYCVKELLETFNKEIKNKIPNSIRSFVEHGLEYWLYDIIMEQVVSLTYNDDDLW